MERRLTQSAFDISTGELSTSRYESYVVELLEDAPWVATHKPNLNELNLPSIDRFIGELIEALNDLPGLHWFFKHKIDFIQTFLNEKYAEQQNRRPHIRKRRFIP